MRDPTVNNFPGTDDSDMMAAEHHTYISYVMLLRVIIVLVLVHFSL